MLRSTADHKDMVSRRVDQIVLSTYTQLFPTQYYLHVIDPPVELLFPASQNPVLAVTEQTKT